MASDSEACCDEDPNFAVICAFFEKFGELIGITGIDFCELQSMLENLFEVSPLLIDLHVKLLRKIRKSVKPDKWEKQLVNFCHTFSNVDAWELERFGYKQAKLSSKIRALKELLEAQFDQNSKFKTEINKLTSKDLRSQPLGRDKFGHAYWFHSDDNYQIRVYKEDLDDEKWSLVAKDRTGLVSLIASLTDGDVKQSSDSAGNEDSNSLSEKPIIDTGQQDSDSKKTSDEETLEKDVDVPEPKHDTIEEEESTDLKKDESAPIEEEVETKATLKRARDEEEDDEDDNQKHKVKTTEEHDSPIIGEAVEDPPLKVEGEGSGAENDSPPIIGEVIEEQIMWFFGNGSGAECLAGNQSGDEKSTETKTEKEEIDTGKSEEKVDNKRQLSETKAENEEKGSEDEKTEISNHSVEEKPVEEPVCTKKVAYICGEEKDDTEGDNDKNVVENGTIDGSEEGSLVVDKEKLPQELTEQSDLVSNDKLDADVVVKKKRGRPKRASKTTNIDEKSNSASSSPNSPNPSTEENSVISIADTNDPATVSSIEGLVSEKKEEAASGNTLSSLSFDFKDSTTASTNSNKPSPMRAVRKRGLETAPTKPQEEDDETGKRMKLKGRRPIDTALRKSVEQRIEQLHGSSSDSKDSEEEKRAKKPGRKKKGDKVVVINRHPEKKNSRILSGLQIDDDFSNERPQLRQSRRIAQLKIKEQSLTKIQADKEEKRMEKEHDKKKHKVVSDSESEEKPEKVKKKKKEKLPSQMFNEKKPWQSSSEDSEDAEEEEEEIIEEEDDVPLGPLKSDHEFSPESEEDDEEWQPLKRARTARKESDVEEGDDLPCQKCLKSDHPEWILLCDKCNNGWHCSCLRPPLLSIPEGDWFCPPCEHIILLEKLQDKLVEYDKKLSKKEIEDRRKERLAYVGISLNNVLPNAPKEEHRKKKRRHDEEEQFSESEEESEESEDEDSYSDEPIYQLRQRRQTKSYKFNEYDDLIKDAIGEDADKPEDTAGNLGRGKDIQTIVKGMEEEEKKAKEGDEERPKANLKKMLRKKHRKLNSLDFDSEEEDISDEDFKGGSEDEDEEEDYEEGSEDSDDYVGRKRRKNVPTRRSTRARIKRYDSDFIDDDSEDQAPRRKKKKSIWDESETEESDNSYYGSRKKAKKKKKRVGSNAEVDSKTNKPRIKYGGLTSSDDEELGRGIRTRGKKTTYVDTLGSDTDEGETVVKKNPRRIESDDEDFVANEEDEIDEDKDSEEKVVEEDEEDVESDENGRASKPRLIVPKIYIKKPLGNKKVNGPGQVKESAEENLENSVSTRLESLKEESVGRNIPLDSKSGNDRTLDLSRIGDATKQIPSKRPRNIHQPIVSNVTSLIKNDADNEDLSEPPGIALHFVEDYNSNGPKSANLDDSPKKRRGRGPTKKKPEDVPAKTGNILSPGKKLPEPAIEIAAPPQPFSQAQPTPSVITRMLQSKPGLSIFPVGRIRPKQFATMKDEDSDETSPKISPVSSPIPPSQYMQGVPRGPPIPPYPPHLTMNHYPRGPPLPYHRPPPPMPYPPPTPANGGPYPVVSNGPYPQPFPPVNGPITQEDYYAGYPPPPVPAPRPEEEEERGGEGEYEGMAPQDVDYSEGQSNPAEESAKNEEGEFAGLASYFSSQREDDLDS